MQPDQLSIKPFHVMAKPSGALCNLSCSYCFYKSKDQRNDKTQFMSNETLENYLRQVISSEPTGDVTISWQGGEPTLLGINFYRKAVEIATKYLPKRKMLHWTMKTNGILIDHKWCEFFRENHYLVGLSLDGPKEVHDAYRKNSQGEGTFDRVIQAVELLKEYNVDFNVLCCVHSANGDKGLQVYRFLRDNLGVRYIQFIPVVEHDDNINHRNDTNLVTSRSVEPVQWGKFLIEVFDEWVHRDVGQVFVLLFDWVLCSWLGLESPACIFQQECGRALVLERNGDVYSCDHLLMADIFLEILTIYL